MPRGKYSDLISNEQARVHRTLVATTVSQMHHGDDGYFTRRYYGVDELDKSDERPLWILGYESVRSSEAIQKLAEEEEELGFARVIRISGKNKKGTFVDGYIVDDSFYNIGIEEGSAKVPRLDLSDPDIPVHKVIRFAGETFGAERTYHALRDQFALDVGKNILHNYAEATD